MPELTHSDPSAHAPIRSAGTRRITLTMRAWLDRADQFEGLPADTAKPFEVLAAFEQALPYLGLPAQTHQLVCFLVRLSQPQDWQEGSRPIVWPSSLRVQELLGVTAQRVKALTRFLCEAGIIAMRDHPQGKRYGRRDAKGRIIEAYGFDLSLLAQRREEFVKIAAAAAIERKRMRDLKRRCTLARRGIHQAAEELGHQGHHSHRLMQIVRETAEIVKAVPACGRSDELALAVKALESRKAAAEQMLRELIKPVETCPQGQEKLPHNTTTSLMANDINHTVIASEECSRAEARPPKPQTSQEAKPLPERLDITAPVLVELAPRLAPYMPARSDARDWPALIEAALWLSAEMGINRTLWSRACQVMGREYAAVALAIVSTRPAQHFTSGPGGYFAGMLRKFERGELCLSRTLWKLKDQAWAAERRRNEQRY